MSNITFWSAVLMTRLMLRKTHPANAHKVNRSNFNSRCNRVWNAVRENDGNWSAVAENLHSYGWFAATEVEKLAAIAEEAYNKVLTLKTINLPADEKTGLDIGEVAQETDGVIE